MAGTETEEGGRKGRQAGRDEVKCKRNVLAVECLSRKGKDSSTQGLPLRLRECRRNKMEV